MEGSFSSILRPGHVSRFHIARLSTPMKRRSCGSGAKNRSKSLARRRLPDCDTLPVLSVTILPISVVLYVLHSDAAAAYGPRDNYSFSAITCSILTSCTWTRTTNNDEQTRVLLMNSHSANTLIFGYFLHRFSPSTMMWHVDSSHLPIEHWSTPNYVHGLSHTNHHPLHLFQKPHLPSLWPWYNRVE